MKLKWMIIGASVLLAIPKTRKYLLDKIMSMSDIVDSFVKGPLKEAKQAVKD
jgi:hypothetical protein